MTSAMSLRHVRLFGRHFIAIAVIVLPLAGFAAETTATPGAQAGVGNTSATKSMANPAPATAGNNRIAEWIVATNPEATPTSVHTAAADSSPTPAIRHKPATPATTSTPVASSLTASAGAPARAVNTATTAPATKTTVAPTSTHEAISRKAAASRVVAAKTAVIPARKPVVITQRTTVRTATTVRTPTTVKKVVASARKPVAATRKTTTRTLVTTKTRTPAKPAARRPLAASTVVKRRASPAQSRARAAVQPKAPAKLRLAAASALVVDSLTGEAIYLKNADKQMPIASITKLMTAMVVLDSKPDLQATITISGQDVDHLKHTTSRLPIGASLTRLKLLQLALMSSENRAASALSRAYPGGRAKFIQAMQAKAVGLGMTDTRFNDPTGLTPANTSTAADLVKLVKAASSYDLIRRFTTTTDDEIRLGSAKYPLAYKNTNRLVRGGQWDIAISKTGFINEAGHCLVMLAGIAQRQVVMVFLDAPGKLTPFGDATRFKNWMEAGGGGLKLAAAK